MEGWKKGRFPLAEEGIRKMPYMAVSYARVVMKGRWPDAEEEILKLPNAAIHYARDVIKGRWPEAESVLAAHPNRNLFIDYCREVVGMDPCVPDQFDPAADDFVVDMDAGHHPAPGGLSSG